MKFILFKIRYKIKSLIAQKRIYDFNIKNECNVNLSCNITGDLKNLSVGKGTAINSLCNIRNKLARVNIGRNCLIARNVSIVTSQYKLESESIGSESDTGDVFIGDNVWIGTNVVIMPGVNIGSGSVIGAQSVVTKDVLPMTVNCGVPSKKISKRELSV